MWRNNILLLYIYFVNCQGFFMNHDAKIKMKKEALELNMEVYESINECNVSQIHTCGEQCPLCLGTKTNLCNYCRGTGFLTMGNDIIGTGNNCSICNGIGEMECSRCKGSGYIARWRKQISKY